MKLVSGLTRFKERVNTTQNRRCGCDVGDGDDVHYRPSHTKERLTIPSWRLRNKGRNTSFYSYYTENCVYSPSSHSNYEQRTFGAGID